jgi:hypothetical protein
MITRKKIIYPVNEALRKYLRLYQREKKLPVSYSQLRDFLETIPVIDARGKDTLWESVLYPHEQQTEIHNGLKKIYAMLKAGGDEKVQRHLYIERIDFCTFGNTHPFRIKIVNSYNDVHDYFYVKIADASRVYGLELEHILSPNQLNYLVHENTLVEEHIAGIPGDVFLPLYSTRPEFNPKRIGKEFVKFNERCFIRLLGDMRAYNFVFDITPDFDDFQFRIRAIDFDQQFFEGSLKIYLPQYFKENSPYVDMALKHFNKDVMMQYQQEERALIARRIKEERYRLRDLRDVLVGDEISTNEKIKQLGFELAEYYEDAVFERCTSMGELIDRSLKRVLVTTHVKQSNM